MTIQGFDTVLPAAQVGAEWAWSSLVRAIAPSLIDSFRSQGVPDPEGLAGDVFFDLARNIGTFEGDESDLRSRVALIAARRMPAESQVRTPSAHPAGSGMNEQTLTTIGRSSAILAANTAAQLAAERAVPAEHSGKAAGALLMASARRSVGATTMAAAMFFGSASGIAFAADGAKPGDALYGIDRALEAIGIGNGHADERIAEVNALFESGEVRRGLEHAADLLDGTGPEKAAAAVALRNAAENVTATGSDQSADVRVAVAGLLTSLSKGHHEFSGLDVAELAREIGPPEDPSNGKGSADPGPPEDSQAGKKDKADIPKGPTDSPGNKP